MDEKCIVVYKNDPVTCRICGKNIGRTDSFWLFEPKRESSGRVENIAQLRA
jgi:hypothetical protein